MPLGPGDRAFLRSIQKRFSKGSITAVDIFREIGARGGRTIPPLQPPVTIAPFPPTVGIPGPVGFAPGPGGRTLPGMGGGPAIGGGGPAAGGSRPRTGRERTRAAQKKIRAELFPRGATRGILGAQERSRSRKELRGERGTSRAQATSTQRQAELREIRGQRGTTRAQSASGLF